MKVLVATHSHQFLPSDYCWCAEGELVCFGLFQYPNNEAQGDISMCGFQSRRFTTTVKVVDLDLSVAYYTELLADGLRAAELLWDLDEQGYFQVTFDSPRWGFRFNLHHLVSELLGLVRYYDPGEVLRVWGRRVYPHLQDPPGDTSYHPQDPRHMLVRFPANPPS